MGLPSSVACASTDVARRSGENLAALAKTAIRYPPMQKGASFNLEAVKEQIGAAVKGATVSEFRAGRSAPSSALPIPPARVVAAIHGAG